MPAPTPKPTNPFDARAFVALSLVLSGIGLPATGIMNHLYQSAPITTRHGWMAAHNALAAVVVVFAIWHIVLNWKVLARHVGVGARRLSRKREALWATTMVALVLVAAVGHTLH